MYKFVKKMVICLAIITPLIVTSTAMAKSAKYTALKVSKLNTASKTVTGTATKAAKITVKHGSKTLGTSNVSSKGKYSVKVGKLSSWSLKVSASKKKYRTKTVTVKVVSLPKTIKSASMIIYYRNPSNKLLATSKQTLRLNSKFKAPKKSFSCYTASKSKYSGFTVKSNKITKLTKKPTCTITYKYAKNVLTPTNKKSLKSKVSKYDSALQLTKSSYFYKSNSSNTITAYNNAVTQLDNYVAAYLKNTGSPSKISSSFTKNETKLLNACQTTQTAYNSAKSEYDKLHTLTIGDKQALNKQISTINNKFDSAKNNDFYKTGTDKTIQAYSDAVTKLNQFLAPYSLTQFSTSYIDASFNANVQKLIDKVKTTQNNYSIAKSNFDAKNAYLGTGATFFDTNFNKIGTINPYVLLKINESADDTIIHNGQFYTPAIFNGTKGYVLSSTDSFFVDRPSTSANYSIFLSTLSPLDCGNPTNFEPNSAWFQLDVNAQKKVIWEFKSDTNSWIRRN